MTTIQAIGYALVGVSLAIIVLAGALAATSWLRKRT